MVVVGLWGILLDTDDKALTLRKLRNQVMSKAFDETARRRIADELRSHDVDTRIKQIERKISRLRHQHFAHIEATEATGSTVNPEDSPLTFEELRELATAAHDLINVIGMNTYYMTLFSVLLETQNAAPASRIQQVPQKVRFAESGDRWLTRRLSERSAASR